MPDGLKHFYFTNKLSPYGNPSLPSTLEQAQPVMP